jgi:hypothetical protein
MASDSFDKQRGDIKAKLLLYPREFFCVVILSVPIPKPVKPLSRPFGKARGVFVLEVFIDAREGHKQHARGKEIDPPLYAH